MANEQPKYVERTWQIPKDLGNGRVLADDCVITGPHIGRPVTVNYDPRRFCGYVKGFDATTRTVTMELDPGVDELIRRQAKDFGIGYSMESATAGKGEVRIHEARVHDVSVIPTPPAEKPQQAT